MNKLYYIKSENILDYHEKIFPMIDAACTHSVGKYIGNDVIKELIKGNMQLWIIADSDKINGICITELVNFPQIKMVRFICCTGENANEWVHLIDEIEQWAVNLGCKLSQAECRPGWEKILKDFGYRKNHVILNKVIK